ncbi:MAG: chemotaxis protein CheC [Candidatus Altiarchaeota archaeon]|nr:chemotaxis protein CheC [Candidatus Altiarchaeota archaeon]
MTLNLTELAKDALKEVIAIAMWHSSTALSKMIDERVNVRLTKLSLIPISQIPKYFGKNNVLSVGVYSRVLGDISGTTILIFPRKTALIFIDTLEGREVGTTDMVDMEGRSILEEIGSILTATFMNAIADFVEIKIYPSQPVTVFNFASSIVNFVLLGVRREVNVGLIVEVEFKGLKGEVSGNFIILLESNSATKLLTLIDKKTKENIKEKKGKSWVHKLFT